MKVSEAIEKLTNKRNDALSFMSDIYKKGDAGYLANEIRVTTYNIAINTLQQIDEPQAEKVEVPDFVAEWYEEHKYDLDNSIWACVSSITQFRSRELELNDFEKWFSDFNNEPIETLIRMKDGYTVKPKRWVVRQGGSEVWYLQGFRNSLDGDIVKQWCSHEGCIKFTDRAKAEAVATLVEGSVEEV